jgi:two-component system chemotaxis sensor kinase CheA
MSIRQRFLLVLLGTFGLLFGVFIAFSQISLKNDFRQLEDQEMSSNTERLKNTHQGELDVIHKKVVDYAKWDASYNFTLSPSQDFIDENYGGQILEGLGLNAVVHFGKQGELLYAVSNDSMGAEPHAKTDPELIRVLREQWTMPWIQSAETKDSVAHDYRLMAYQGKVLVVSRHSMLDSEGEKQPYGMLFFCRYLDSEILGHLRDKTKLNVQAIPQGKLPQLGDRLKLKVDTVHLEKLDDANFRGTLLLPDDQGQPVMAYEATFPRKVMAVGKVTIQTVLIAIVIMGIILLIAVVLTANGVVLKRLVRLQKDLVASGEDQKPVTFDGRKDEIGYLQQIINALFGDLRARKAQIEQRNRDMAAMLGNLEQGLFMVDRDAKVHPEFASSTPKILAQTPTSLVGKDVSELLLSASTWSEDLKSQARESIQCCVGADSLQYELNCDGLPQELHWILEDQEVFLELTWAPIYDENDEADRLLVSVRDVTSLRALEAEMRQQREELLLLEKLLQVSPKDLDRFADLSLGRLELVKSHLERGIESPVVLNEVFRELHTLKGNSRILGFADVASAVHDAEDPVQEMRRTGVDDKLIELCTKRLERVQAAIATLRKTYLERFAKIIGHQENCLFVPRSHLDSLFREFADRDHHQVSDVEDWIASFKDVVRSTALKQDEMAQIPQLDDELDVNSDEMWSYLKSLASSSFVSLEEIIAKQNQGLATAASNLGKPLMRIVYPQQELMLRAEYAEGFGEAMGHLLRNSLDHGIELPEVRKQLDKPEQGQIHLDVSFVEIEVGTEVPNLVLQDDGAGIHLERLKAKVEAAGIPVEGRSNQWIVEQIFLPGLSTKEAVSELSGRGVGMDAVRALIEKMGGEIEVEALEINEHGNIPLRFKIQFPRLSTLIFNRDTH